MDGEKLTFSGIAGTMMACPNGMTIERQIHEMFPLRRGLEDLGRNAATDVSSNGIADRDFRVGLSQVIPGWHARM